MLLTAVTHTAQQLLPQFNAQAIKDTLWGFATIGYCPPRPFLAAAAQLCYQLIEMFNPQNIVRPHVMDMPADFWRCLPSCYVFRSLSLSVTLLLQANALWSFAKFGYNPGR